MNRRLFGRLPVAATVCLLFLGSRPTAIGQNPSPQEPRGISYDSLYQLFIDKMEVERRGFGTLTIRISDISDRVPTNKITLQILSSIVSQRITLNRNGVFKLPMDSRLQAENPSIISNLPPGGTKLDIVYAYDVTQASKRFCTYASEEPRYGELLREMKVHYGELQEILKRTSQDCRLFNNRVDIESRFPTGITLKIEKPNGADVIIRTASGNLTFPVTTGGYCQLPILTRLLLENPPMQIPGKVWTWRIDYDRPGFKKSLYNIDLI